jgi:16S rRNA (guanine(966)-N(2))-methyltransferase RsmD
VSAPVRASHDIRIIGGQWKRTRLQVRDLPGLRPTPDRVRETLFNWLGQDLTGWRCLDAFAGTGVLGLEAASRGAGEVTLVEQERSLAEQITKTASRLQANAVRVVRGDGVAALRQCAPGSLDLVFLDPPFDSAVLEPALRAAQATLSATGFIYLEAPAAWRDEQLAPLGLVLHRHLKAGAVHAHLLKRAAATHA